VVCLFGARRFAGWVVLPGSSEDLNERPDALFLTLTRESLSSRQLGDSVEAGPKEFRHNLRLRAPLLEQFEELRESEAHFRRSRTVVKGYCAPQ